MRLYPSSGFLRCETPEGLHCLSLVATATDSHYSTAQTFTPAVPASAPPSFDSMHAYIGSFSRPHRRLPDDLQLKSTEDQVWKAFRFRRKLILATDGGLANQRGTFGWILSTGTQSLFTCAGPVDGPFDTSSSTRSELAGYASTVLFLRTLSRFCCFKFQVKLKWFYDSRAATSEGWFLSL